VNKLDPIAISLLNNLVEVCRDGYFAYAAAKQQIKSAELQGYFNLVSLERLRYGQQLLLELFKTDGEWGKHGLHVLERPLPWQVAAHRFHQQDDKFILRELARLEDFSLKQYEIACRIPWPTELRALLESHYTDLKRVHQHIQAEAAAALKRLGGTSARSTKAAKSVSSTAP